MNDEPDAGLELMTSPCEPETIGVGDLDRAEIEHAAPRGRESVRAVGLSTLAGDRGDGEIHTTRSRDRIMEL